MGSKLAVVTDGWSPDDGTNYSPDDFYVRSVNKHDHAETIRLRMPNDVLGQVSQIVQGKVFGEHYRTTSDFLRDAVVHRLWYLQQMIDNDELGRFLHLEMSVARAERAKREVELALSTVDIWDRTLEAIAREGDCELLEIQLDAVRVVVDGWRDPWRARLQVVVEKYEREAARLRG